MTTNCSKFIFIIGPVQLKQPLKKAQSDIEELHIDTFEDNNQIKNFAAIPTMYKTDFHSDKKYDFKLK